MTVKTPAVKNTRVNEIDLLRFVAALAVVFFHYAFRGYAADAMSVMPYPLFSSFAKYGYLGVDLFFMISGFVILMTAASGSLRDFVVSRFVRLYPAFWTCCTITFVLTLAIGAPRYSASLSQYLINMTMLSNYVGTPPLDGSYWSLFVEMRFYGLVAVVLIIGRIHQAQLFLIIWLIASIALELLPTGNTLSSLLIVNYSAYFIAGATCYLVWSQGISSTRASLLIVSWGLAIFHSFDKMTVQEKLFNTDMNIYIVATIITSFFIVMLLISLKHTGFVGRNRWQLAGVLTYPLYLLHQNIGFMVFNVAYPTINPHILLWGTIIMMLGAAYAVHAIIEKRYSMPIKEGINSLFNALQRFSNVWLNRDVLH